MYEPITKKRAEHSGDHQISANDCFLSSIVCASPGLHTFLNSVFLLLD